RGERLCVAAGAGLPTAAAVVSDGERRFKVRRYRSAEAAHSQLELLSAAARLFARCHGEVGECLVFEYEDGASPPPDHEGYRRIGSFIADLENLPVRATGEVGFDRWCDEVSGARVLSPAVVARLRDEWSSATHAGLDM